MSVLFVILGVVLLTVAFALILAPLWALLIGGVIELRSFLRRR